MRLDRLNQMEQYIIERGAVSLGELVQHYGVSLNTIRRDLKELIARGRLKKVYGGVASNAAYVSPPSGAVRPGESHTAKDTIGRMAAALVQDNTSIFLDAGTTTPKLLPYLGDRVNVTIISHNLNVLYEAAKYPHLRVIGLGGEYSPLTAAYYGINTADSISHFCISTAFTGANGVSLESGLTSFMYLDAELKRNLLRFAPQVVLMVDHTKFDVMSLVSYHDFENLYAVVTDKTPPEAYLRAMERNNIRLLCPGADQQPAIPVPAGQRARY